MSQSTLRGIVVLGISGWSLTFLWAFLSYLRNGSAEAGQFGDAFGVINALFSMLAMIGAATAVYLQHIELQDSKKATADQQVANIEQRAAQEKILAEQARASQAEAIRAIATSVTAWTDLTARIPYKGDVKIPYLKLATEEFRSRVLLEVFLEGLIEGNTLSVEQARSSERWKNAEARADVAKALAKLSERISEETEGHPDGKAMQASIITNYDDWMKAALPLKLERLLQTLRQVHSIVHSEDWAPRQQNAIDALQKEISLQIKQALGLFKATA